MGGKANTTGHIPPLPKDIRRLVQGSANAFVRQADDMINRLNSASRALPKKYGWRFRSVEAMTSELQELMAISSDFLPVNELYWRDMLGNWEAHSVMSAFRVIDLARSCVWALGRQDVACAALLARSALESASAYLDIARIVSRYANEIPAFSQPGDELRTHVVVSTELEERSLKTIFASRLSESEDIYSPTNIVTIITRIARTGGHEFIKDVYEILCEIAHPNWLGRSLYVQSAEPGAWEGNELRTISRQPGPMWEALAEPIVAALSWSCATQVSAFQLMNQATFIVLSRMETAKQAGQ